MVVVTEKEEMSLAHFRVTVFMFEILLATFVLKAVCQVSLSFLPLFRRDK